MKTASLFIIRLSIFLVVIGLGWHFIGSPVWQFMNHPFRTMAAIEEREHPKSARSSPSPTPEQPHYDLIPVSNPSNPLGTGVGDKIVVIQTKFLFDSQESLHAFRDATAVRKAAGFGIKDEEKLQRKIDRMLKDGEAYQLNHYMRATVVLVDGNDVKINQRPEAGDMGAQWWIDIADTQ